MSQCKIRMEVEGEPKHFLYCIKDEGHIGEHQLGKIPLSLKISCFIKETLWYKPKWFIEQRLPNEVKQ